MTAGNILWELGKRVCDNQASDHLNWSIVPFVIELADPTFDSLFVVLGGIAGYL